MNVAQWAFRSAQRAKVGTCMKCMRTAFLAAIASAILAITLTVFDLPTSAVSVVWTFAFLLLCLWFLHGWMFTQRSIKATALRADEATGVVEGLPTWTRRKMLFAVARVLLFSAAAMTLPRGARASGCNCYTEDNCYCPDDFPQCIYNPTTGDSICCGSSSNGCAGPTETWCCDAGHTCSGDEGYCY